MKLSTAVVVIWMLFAAHTLAEVYKWVDRDGITHYADCPPLDCAYEELELPEGPSEEEIKAAEEETRKILDARKDREAAEKAKRENETLKEQQQEQLRAERLKKCAQASYQLNLLNQKRRVFKLQDDGVRRYLENEDRPGEISRITVLKDEYCDTGRSARKEQLDQAHELRVALSPRCAAARVTLEKMQQPDASPTEDKLQSYQAYVRAYCPSTESDDLWLGDWIIVRRKYR